MVFDGLGAYHPVEEPPKEGKNSTVGEMNAYLNGWHAGYREGRKDGALFGDLR